MKASSSLITRLFGPYSQSRVPQMRAQLHMKKPLRISCVNWQRMQNFTRRSDSFLNGLKGLWLFSSVDKSFAPNFFLMAKWSQSNNRRAMEMRSRFPDSSQKSLNWKTVQESAKVSARIITKLFRDLFYILENHFRAQTMNRILKHWF